MTESQAPTVIELAEAVRSGQRTAVAAASAGAAGSMPRAKSVSRRASMLGRPSARFTSVLKLNAGKWPS